MRLELTAAQSAQLMPLMRHGSQLLARVDREQFDGTNPATSGRLVLVVTAIPSARLDAVRAAIAGEGATVPGKKRKALHP